MYICIHIHMWTCPHIYMSTWLHNFMNLFRPDFLHFTMLGLISLNTLFHNILHKGTDSKTLLMSNGLYLVNKGF